MGVTNRLVQEISFIHECYMNISLRQPTTFLHTLDTICYYFNILLPSSFCMHINWQGKCETVCIRCKKLGCSYMSALFHLVYFRRLFLICNVFSGRNQDLCFHWSMYTQPRQLHKVWIFVFFFYSLIPILAWIDSNVVTIVFLHFFSL